MPLSFSSAAADALQSLSSLDWSLEGGSNVFPIAVVVVAITLLNGADMDQSAPNELLNITTNGESSGDGWIEQRGRTTVGKTIDIMTRVRTAPPQMRRERERGCECDKFCVRSAKRMKDHLLPGINGLCSSTGLWFEFALLCCALLCSSSSTLVIMEDICS